MINFLLNKEKAQNIEHRNRPITPPASSSKFSIYKEKAQNIEHRNKNVPNTPTPTSINKEKAQNIEHRN